MRSPRIFLRRATFFVGWSQVVLLKGLAMIVSERGLAGMGLAVRPEQLKRPAPTFDNLAVLGDAGN